MPHSPPNSDHTPASSFVPRTWTRFGYQLQEIGKGIFQVRDGAGRKVGWVSTLGPRYRAHADAQTLEQSAVLGTFLSGAAALRLIIGNDRMTVLRATVLKEVQKLEREFEATRLPSAVGRHPSSRTNAPHESSGSR
jgi:hypothetical protein